MKSEWTKKKLSDIADFNPRETIKKGAIAKKIPMDVLRPFYRDIPYYVEEDFSGGTKFRNGDTIMARITPCLENGKTAQVSILNDGEVGFGSTEYIVFRAKEGIADKDYLYYLVCSPEVREPAIKSMVGSSGRQRVQTDVVKNLEIDVPPLVEQEKIGSFLKALDDKIALNDRINKNLEQQAQAIYRSWFVNYEPFDGTKPDDWSDGTIDDLGTEIICGKTPSTKKSEYYGGNTPFITIPDMHGCVYIVSTERYLSDAGVASQPKKTLPPNTVCVSCIGTAGLVTLVSEESQSNQQINSIIPKEGISEYYIYLLMQTLAETINKLGQSGSTIVNLNKTQFGKIQVMIPSKRVLQDFDSLCRPLFDTILSNQKENINLSELRDTLLPKLMSGELDVSNIKL
ncbi:restriction endonuclease subunit S [Streptococcus suis]|nr:restriction endonuclease subunit S [Streptococcus suis]HEM3561072.1 restriction endonuclease subunit S [Streptococcus suis]